MMRSILVGLVLVSTVSLGLVATPEAEAFGICTVGDVYNNMHEPCDGIVCYGYSNGHWHTCVQIRTNPTP